METDIDEIVKPYLEENEQILWHGRPEKRIIMTPWDVFIELVTLVIFSFVFWLVDFNFFSINIPYSFLGILPLSITFYWAFVRIFYEYLEISRYKYFLTQHKVIIVKNEHVDIILLKDLPWIIKEKTLCENIGTIYFNHAPDDFIDNRYNWFVSDKLKRKCFANIKNVDNVYDCIENLMAKSKEQ